MLVNFISVYIVVILIRPKYTKFAFHWGFALRSQTAGGASSAFKTPYLYKWREGKERKGREGERRWMGGFGPLRNFCVASL